MRQPFLRYITGDAGHVKRLYDAVKIAQEYPDMAALQREILAERKTDSEKSKRYRGLTKPRSYEPHQALARELGILERGERWRVTSSVGKPFLVLWENKKSIPPTYLLLSQHLRYDRTMTVPFLDRLLKEKTNDAAEIIADIWEMIWKNSPREMELAQPLLPRSLRHEDGRLKRTANHHAQFRIRFLQSEEGLNLKDDQLKRIIESFKNFKSKEFPSDYYSKIGFIVDGYLPKILSTKKVEVDLLLAHKKFQRFGYASASAVFHFLNDKILPKNFLDWADFLKYLRTSEKVSLSPSSKEDDILFTIKRER